MDPQRIRCMIVLPDGVSRRVGPGGVVIGRQPDCDLVTHDLAASRRHALIRLTLDGAEVVPLGKSPVEVNGKATTAIVALAHGDRLAVPGLVGVLDLAIVRPEAATAVGYQLARSKGGSFGVTHSPFVIGSAATDDLIVKRWPPGALRLRLAGGELYAEAGVDGITVNAAPLAVGTVEPIGTDDRLALAAEVFTVSRRIEPVPATQDRQLQPLPTRVAIETLPRGGRAVFTMVDGDHSVYLADRRLDLLIALARPPAGHRAGDFVPDDAVRAVVWPRNPGVSRQEINMLISRCRRDLVLAGLPGSRLLERAPGGGGTRIALAAAAVVVVVS